MRETRNNVSPPGENAWARMQNGHILWGFWSDFSNLEVGGAKIPKAFALLTKTTPKSQKLYFIHLRKTFWKHILDITLISGFVGPENLEKNSLDL